MADPLGFLHGLAQQSGDIVHWKLGTSPAVLVTDPYLIGEWLRSCVLNAATMPGSAWKATLEGPGDSAAAPGTAILPWADDLATRTSGRTNRSRTASRGASASRRPIMPESVTSNIAV
jgi:hypothetical protein